MGDSALDTPLTPLTMALLLALVDDDRHGYALIKEVEEQTDGRLRPGTGSLYAALQRLVEEGLISEVVGPRLEGGRTRRTFRITTAGRLRTRAEAERMARVLALARRKSVLPRLDPAPEGNS
jgi:DNA-binding PadR family transcriptional regulator